MRKNKSTVVVGGSSGIGMEFAKYFLQHTYDVAIISRNTDRLLDAKKYLERFNFSKNKLEVFNGDATNESIFSSLGNAFDFLRGMPDYVVYTAGTSIPGKFSNLALEKYEQSLNVNYMGFVRLVYFLFSRSLSKKIQIILISSMAALIDTFGYTTYAPTKIALRSFARGLSYENKNASFYVVYPIDTLTKQLIEENETKPLETFLIDESGGITTPDKIVSYTMKIAEKEKNKNFYEIIPEGKLIYLVSKLFPWIVEIAINRAVKKAEKIRKMGKEKEVIEKITQKYRKKFEEFKNKQAESIKFCTLGYLSN